MLSPDPHYIVVCVGTRGDVHPFMRIALALQAMGRRVSFVTNTYHAELLRGSGLRCVGLGTVDDYLSVVADPDIWHPRRAFATLMARYEDHLLALDAAIRSLVTDTPTALVAHPLAVPGAAIAREEGLIDSIVALHLAPATLRTCHDPMRLGEITVPAWVPMRWRKALWRAVERRYIDPAAMLPINAARNALHLPAVCTSFLEHLEDAPDLTVTLFPPWFGPTMPDWPRPLLTGDFQLFEAQRSDALGDALTAFLAAGAKPVVMTPGTGNVHARRFLACALAAAQSLGLRAIVLTPERAQVPAELPPTVLWQPYVPLSALLPQAEALIHHGGVGTTAEALRAATPQVVTPFAWDQFDNAARVVQLGAGVALPARSLSARKLTVALRQVVASPALRARCEEVSRRLDHRQDPAALCAQIEAQLMIRPRLASSVSAPSGPGSHAAATHPGRG